MVYIRCPRSNKSEYYRGGPSFDAQRQFLANVEDSIAHEVDIPKSIKNYEDCLQYARSKLDFVLGEGLYMIPSEMELKIGRIGNYNNEIIVATSSMSLGANKEVNEVVVTKSEIQKVLPNEVVVTKSEIQKVLHKITVSNHEQNKAILVVGAVSVGLGYYLFA